MKSDDFYTAAFLAVLPVCLQNHRSSYLTEEVTEEVSHSILVTVVEEAHDLAVVAREKWLAEKEKTRRRGGRPQ
jgi:hypothetical protein